MPSSAASTYRLCIPSPGIYDTSLPQIWSGRWESNPPLNLGKVAYYHYTTPASAVPFSLLAGHDSGSGPRAPLYLEAVVYRPPGFEPGLPPVGGVLPLDDSRDFQNLVASVGIEPTA